MFARVSERFLYCHGRVGSLAHANAYFTLPVAAAGMHCCFDGGGFAGVITVDPGNGTDVIWLDGAALTAGYAIDSPGAASDQICLRAPASGKWITCNRNGTWIDGGAD